MSQLADVFSGNGFDEKPGGLVADRLPPHSIEAEMCLLASMMLDADVIGDVSELVGRADFYLADHQMIFEALLDLWKAGSDIDAVILRAELAKRGLLEEIGGMPYIAELMAVVPSAAHWRSYAKTVRETSLLRQVMEAAQKSYRAVFEPCESAKEVFEAAQQRFFEIGDKRQRGDGPVHAGPLATEFYSGYEAGGQTASSTSNRLFIARCANAP